MRPVQLILAIVSFACSAAHGQAITEPIRINTPQGTISGHASVCCGNHPTTASIIYDRITHPDGRVEAIYWYVNTNVSGGGRYVNFNGQIDGATWTVTIDVETGNVHDGSPATPADGFLVDGARDWAWDWIETRVVDPLHQQLVLFHY